MGLASISSVRDVSNEMALHPMSEDDYRSRFPDPSMERGTPLYYVPLALSAVAIRPSNASEIFIKSTSALDIQTVYWSVLTSTGEVRTGNTTLTGVTAVSLNTGITTVVQVLSFYLSQGANGTVTLHEDSGLGAELARITVGSVSARSAGSWRSCRRQATCGPSPSKASAT